jgi:UDP-glucose 4-epimerase
MSYTLVTGAAGFIGSHLVKRLIDDEYRVKALDNFSSGRLENLAQCDKSKLGLSKTDLRDFSKTVEEFKGAKAVFHFAADPDVKTSGINPDSHYENNVQATFNVLEAMRLNGMKELVFASSSVVYGQAETIPTPEDYPLRPISIYGATKLACEALISGYLETFGIRALVLRPANIIGSNSTHGVILDFIKKLKANPKELEILGDGTQQKSYLHISDFIAATMQCYQHFQRNMANLEIYNIGNHDWLTVMEIAKIVAEEMGLRDVNFNLTGGVDGGRGWKGDVKTMLLSISKITSLGWKPSLSSKETAALSVRELISQMKANET